jgi:ferredoxin-NADP reductase
MDQRLEVRIATVSQETERVRRFELRPTSEALLPTFTAGAHIDICLAPNLTRSYSLLNSQDEQDRYVIGVALEAESRGGSRFLFDNVRAGDRLQVSKPRNLFALNEQAPYSILIGGGIGITPLISMSKRLTSMDRPWHLYYCCRSRDVAPFLLDLGEHGSCVDLRFDNEHSSFLDIASLIRSAPADTHLYCCGPKSMLAAFDAAVAATGVPAEQVHVEYFKPQEDFGQHDGIVVELARSKQTIVVPAGSTILDALRMAGISTQSSCEAGICGECQVGVLDGVPDHRDSVLSNAERASNKMMMICCSGAKSEKLVLDL